MIGRHTRVQKFRCGCPGATYYSRLNAPVFLCCACIMLPIFAPLSSVTNGHFSDRRGVFIAGGYTCIFKKIPLSKMPFLRCIVRYKITPLCLCLLRVAGSIWPVFTRRSSLTNRHFWNCRDAFRCKPYIYAFSALAQFYRRFSIVSYDTKSSGIATNQAPGRKKRRKKKTAPGRNPALSNRDVEGIWENKRN